MAFRQTAFTAFARHTVRICLVLLVLSSPSPMQFVLCHESGQLPRLEQAVNGQCISSAREACEECSEAEMHAHSGPGQESYSHRHCASCQDQVLHASPVNRLAKAKTIAVHHWLGGCLYSFETAAVSSSGASNSLFVDCQDGSPPTAAELVAESTCLLI
ncbi:MAG: hypothetical protein H7A35_01295 [Planctomycetales bacterium]|nr:hypothetical protein [bacterium]UNM08695.1 MAG: hypothetical protein H7A35_01295 [Planctomycetales bacterium]